jgi:alpha-1,3-mannosyltransferase
MVISPVVGAAPIAPPVHIGDRGRDLGSGETTPVSGAHPSLIRVCHLVRQFHPSIGGLESFVASLAESLAPFGCESEIITLDRLFTAPRRKMEHTERVDDVLVQRVPMIGVRRMFLPIIRAPMLASYDVLHVHGIDGMFERIGRESRRGTQVRVATSHGAFFHTPWMRAVKQVYFGSVTRLAARGYDALIANSTSDFELMQKLGRDVTLIPNGVAPLGDFQATGRDLLYLGRLASHKRVDRLIAALAEPSLSDVELHIVGPEWDVSRADLARAVVELGVADRVHLHGRVSAERLQQIARNCGVFVSASTYEGFGMSLIEAMSIGLAPVAHANASFADILSTAPVGRLTRFDDAPEASVAIRSELDLLSDARRAQAREFSRGFSWVAHAKQTDAHYRRLLGAKRASACTRRPARV